MKRHIMLVGLSLFSLVLFTSLTSASAEQSIVHQEYPLEADTPAILHTPCFQGVLIPEPATVTLLLAGSGLVMWRRCRFT